MILAFGSELIKSFEFILNFVNFVNGTKSSACKRIAESRFSDRSFTSQELASFDRENCLSLHSRKTETRRREVQLHFINQLIGLQESDGDKQQDEEDEHDQQDPK